MIRLSSVQFLALLVLALTVIVLMTQTIAFSFKCINFNTLTFSDSEAAFLESIFRRSGLIDLEGQDLEGKSQCSKLPAYLRQDLWEQYQKSAENGH